VFDRDDDCRNMNSSESDVSSVGEWSDEDSVVTESHEFSDNYCGYQPPTGVVSFVDRISADIEPSKFFDRFIKLRRPVIISGTLRDSEWKASRWTNSYLNEKAGKVNLLIEDRKDPAGNGYLLYGSTAPKTDMKYGDFLAALSKSDTRYYLTTQDLERFRDDCDDNGIPKLLYSEPLQSLAGDFPVRPKILGNLIPHQISLWQGVAGKKQRSSSGLHHDFHDNLYVLIRGRKRFRLFPPCTLPQLQVVGKPSVIYPNGLIVYQLSGRRSRHIAVRADGVPMVAVARQKRDSAERQLVAAEERLSILKNANKEATGSFKDELKAAEKTLAECEQQLDDALEELLR
jgi:Cupin-like domain